MDSERIVAVRIRDLLLFNVYLPFDYGRSDCYDEFVRCLGIIESVLTSSNVSKAIIVGDFNVDFGRHNRYFDALSDFMGENELFWVDRARLSNTKSHTNHMTVCAAHGLPT
ncbi:MAG: hypothetical protein AAF497_15975 [Planctomycetota bacterium]